ncbi:MAG TPA: phage tail sheath subtilisin-like domain-containing protein [Herpetosiphonaceae bacterium]
MPVTPTYPGVYIEEIASGVRTITGVATSITAFIGRTLRGPVNEPIQVNSFADFERTFGGLSLGSTLSYAVRDFYLNGGSQAIIVRMYRPFFTSDADQDAAQDAAQDVANAAAAAAAEGGATPASVATAARNAANAAENAAAPRNAAADAVADAAESARDLPGATADSVSDAAADAVGNAAPQTRAQLTVGGLNLEAANEGVWGNGLRARIDYNTRDPDDTNLFNLSIRDTATGATEVIRNVSVQTTATRRIDNVLRQESSLVRTLGALPGARPAASNPGPNGIVPAGDDPFSSTNSTGVVAAGQAVDSQTLTTNDYTGDRTNKRGLYALEKADLFNLLCIPPDVQGGDTASTIYQTSMAYCAERRAFLIVDPPDAWSANPNTAAATAQAGLGSLGLSGTFARNAAIYFPRVIEADPLRDGQLDVFVPCGIIAGVMARTDAQRGVWKAPAGLDAAMNGIQGLAVNLNDAENGMLNPIGINCLRSFPVNGRVVWGARTLRGADSLADEYKYIPVRRLALFLEESLYRGTQWVVFEPNDEPLWAQIRLNIGAFMQNLFRQGAFQGKSPREAYFVKCDSETTTQNDINLGIVNIIVGFAPLKPAEFVIIKLQQMAGQIEV